ncbi:unnamed protein product [Pedinophyceae sp. YPF-701]|nr:unnamed protein product [Pedinophyceae sp. YPF-701]
MRAYLLSHATDAPETPEPDAGGDESWWDRAEEDPDVQHACYYGLAAAYALMGALALIQLLRIQRRVPEYGWTTQKVFFLLNGVVGTLRAFGMGFRIQIAQMGNAAERGLLLDLPGLIFFSTYTLLVLFWAEIYHQARSLPTTHLKPAFVAANTVAYVIQAGIWAFMFTAERPEEEAVTALCSAWFIAALSVIAGSAFLLYGVRLWLMLHRFPVESRGRSKKLREVGLVTCICTVCFTARAVIVAAQSLQRDGASALDVVAHPLFNTMYYALSELLPASLVLFILRKLPPRRPAGYQPVRPGPDDSSRTQSAAPSPARPQGQPAQQQPQAQQQRS